MEETIMFIYVATGILTGIYFIFNEIKKETDDFTLSFTYFESDQYFLIPIFFLKKFNTAFKCKSMSYP